MSPTGDASRRLSALPSPLARAVAFAAVLAGGLCGGLIGAAVVGVGCASGCATSKAVGALVGALGVAGGCAVLAVLALRAMGEWKQARLDELDRGLHLTTAHTSRPSPAAGERRPPQDGAS